MGGIGGAITGSILDSFRGPKTSDVSISFEFGEGAFFHDGITYHAVKKGNVTITEENSLGHQHSVLFPGVDFKW